MPLTEEGAQLFHTLIVKFLFLSKRERTGIINTTVFLATRVKVPDEDNGNKLTRFVRYLQSYPDLDLALESVRTRIYKWWVDSYFGIHLGMKSHAGGTPSLGKGSACYFLTGQKLNTRISMEAELGGQMICCHRSSGHGNS